MEKIRKLMLTSKSRCIEAVNELRTKAFNPTRSNNGGDLESATAIWEADIYKYETASGEEFKGNKTSIYVADIVPLPSASNTLSQYVNEKYEDWNDKMDSDHSRTA